MKLTVLASLFAAASAFAPAKQASTSSALAAFENELGAQVPLGYWDPLVRCFVVCMVVARRAAVVLATPSTYGNKPL